MTGVIEFTKPRQPKWYCTVDFGRSGDGKREAWLVAMSDDAIELTGDTPAQRMRTLARWMEDGAKQFLREAAMLESDVANG